MCRMIRDEPTIDKTRRRGRGAGSNHPGRFDLGRRDEDDGWDIPEPRAGFETHVSEEAQRRQLPELHRSASSSSMREACGRMAPPGAEARVEVRRATSSCRLPLIISTVAK